MGIDDLGKIRRYAKRSLNYLIGNNIGLALEHRLFNSVMLIAIFIIVVNIPFNFFTGLEVTALLFIAFTIALVYAYYLVRFKGHLVWGVMLSSILGIFLFTINYFYSGGIRGASLLSFTSGFCLVMIISPKKLYGFWGAFFILTVMALLMIEYYYPQLVKVTYPDNKAFFTDIAVAYGTCIAIIFFSLFYLKEAYLKEKKSADKRAIELAQLNDEKLKLFSIISHDLQTPLSSLHSYIRLIANDRLTPDERKQVERGLANALHVTQEMLSNMLVWSQGQLQGARIELMDNKLVSVLAPVIDIQQIYAHQKGICMEVNLDDTLHAMVDRNMLQLIVRNLINNAIKFTPQGGNISVTLKRKEAHCLISVEDNGLGIPTHLHDKLFSLKTRSTYGTNNEKGVGLGLFLCREYTLAQSGDIWFKSEPGKGTVFYVSLPLISG